jgi:secreted trypsin-like serine protease
MFLEKKKLNTTNQLTLNVCNIGNLVFFKHFTMNQSIYKKKKKTVCCRNKDLRKSEMLTFNFVIRGNDDGKASTLDSINALLSQSRKSTRRVTATSEALSNDVRRSLYESANTRNETQSINDGSDVNPSLDSIYDKEIQIVLVWLM